MTLYRHGIVIEWERATAEPTALAEPHRGANLDGGSADGTVRFGIDGTSYEIDLSTNNAAAFRRQLAPCGERARRAGTRRRLGRRAAGRTRSADILAWAKDQGIALSGRGRIPADIVEQYHAATEDVEAGRTRPHHSPVAVGLVAGQRCAVGKARPDLPNWGRCVYACSCTGGHVHSW
jgi:Lsr2